MKFTLKYEVLDIDRDLFIREISDFMRRIIREAAVKFAEAALVRIPIRTGFVAGAFGTLTDLVGSRSRLNPIISAFKKEYYQKTILKTPVSGRQFAMQSNQIFVTKGLYFEFNYEVDITYFNIQDVGPGRSPSAPWGAFEAGRNAFINHMNSSFEKLPKITDFIIKRGVSV